VIDLSGLSRIVKQRLEAMQHNASYVPQNKTLNFQHVTATVRQVQAGSTPPRNSPPEKNFTSAKVIPFSARLCWRGHRLKPGTGPCQTCREMRVQSNLAAVERFFESRGRR
jgi:hypothetical protein